ncbi:MAG TPA: ArsR family transcriptional regulator [Chthoniobacteraceae bacterium]|nr:ArsR family transcriptional regulator [Chthoniobacteraceae bacterium]
MHSPTSSKKPGATPSQQLLTAIGSVTRWKILAAIVEEGPMGVTDLANYLKINAPLLSKHVATLRKAGILYQGRGRLSYLAENLRPAPGSREIDFGQIVLRFPGGEK